jgi:hypothetical protein
LKIARATSSRQRLDELRVGAPRGVHAGEREEIDDIASAGVDGARLEGAAVHGLQVGEQIAPETARKRRTSGRKRSCSRNREDPAY